MYKILKNKITKIVISAIVVLCILLVIGKIYTTSEHSVDSDIWRTAFNSGWTVCYDGKEYNNVNISEFKFPISLDIGDSVTIRNRLPERLVNRMYSNPVIRFTTHNSMISVNVNGRLRYSYGLEQYTDNKMVGSGVHNVSIEPYDSGKIISITFTATEQNAFSSFDDVYIYNGDYIYKYDLLSGKIPFTVSLMLIMLGFCIMIITALACIKESRFIELFLVGWMSVMVGGWSICYYNYIQMFDTSIHWSSLLEYSALYIAPIPFLLYFKHYVDVLLNKKMKIVYDIILFVQILLDVVLFGMHFMGINHLPAYLILVHIMIAIEMIYVGVLLVMNARKGDESSKAILLGASIMILLLATEYVVFALKKYFGITITSFKGFAVIGTLIYVFTLITGFVMQIAQKMRISTEKAVLYRMAYTDDLTQLCNRRYCEQKLDSLAIDDMDYGIINFDLNGLKKINDTMGHNMGDALISGFAKILKKTFSGVGDVGRMGGDEFIVIIEGLDGFDYNKYIDDLMHNIKVANMNETRFTYSTSYGYAKSSEISDIRTGTKQDATYVYSLADKRMYECKRQFKLDNNI